MKINAEELHDYFIWHILNKIDGLLRNRKDTGSVLYILHSYPTSKDIRIPSYLDELSLLEKLIKMKLFKEVDDRNESKVKTNNGKNEINKPKSEGIHFHLKINKPLFDKWVKKYNQKIKDYSVKNTLFFSTNGLVEYVDQSGKTYKQIFRVNSTNYKVLLLLIKSVGGTFVSFDQIASVLKLAKQVDLSNERRARDVISAIKKSLGYRGKGLFETYNGFRLNCNIQIKQ